MGKKKSFFTGQEHFDIVLVIPEIMFRTRETIVRFSICSIFHILVRSDRIAQTYSSMSENTFTMAGITCTGQKDTPKTKRLLP